MNPFVIGLTWSSRLLFVLLGQAALAADPVESLVLDRNTGDYFVTYCGTFNEASCVVQQATFVPSTKVDPAILFNARLNPNWSIKYEYTVSNRSDAKQPLVRLTIDPVSNVDAPTRLPKRVEDVDRKELANYRRSAATAVGAADTWNSYVMPSDSGPAFRVTWIYANLQNNKQGLQPGYTQRGFSIMSQDLPGIVLTEASGNSGIPISFADEGPRGDIASQLDSLQERDYVARLTGAPTIVVLLPFDPADTLRRISLEVKRWVDLGLLNAIQHSQIDRLLQAAIASAAYSDKRAIQQLLAAVNKLTEGEISEGDEDSDHGREGVRRRLFDPLAAKILTFDLAYVIARARGRDER